ncbi:hypothetical protein [Nocardioides lijunqiniae]|uniref:hypothetical protein n=1 Tax=Nocardioides lijunqiniae TaxID=2760832 RepID=UPI001878C723|nr:hypothetical protein [Nocardioides lijunqiniae]
MIVSQRLADWALAARLQPSPAPASFVNRQKANDAKNGISSLAYLLRFLRQHAHEVSAIPTFDTDLTRTARTSANARVVASAELHTSERFRWGRLASATFERFVLSALDHFALVLRFDRRRAPAPIGATGAALRRPDSPILLLVQPLVSAACAPPRSVLDQHHLEDLRAA